MKLSRKWLNEFIDLSLEEKNDRDFAEAMTMSGSKVEGTDYMGEGISRVVVGKIVQMDLLWDAGRQRRAHPLELQGRRRRRALTCRSSPARRTRRSATSSPSRSTAPPSPAASTIGTTTFHGALSEGMMCSLKELGLTLHDFPYAYEDGLFVLQEDCKPGDDIVPVIGRDDHVVEFEITPNRPDCLSVIGLAREAAVTFDKPLKLHDPRGQGLRRRHQGARQDRH